MQIKKNLGFSIFELIVALSIASIVIFFVSFNFINIIEKNRTSAYLQILKSAIAFTRTSAIKLNEKVILCIKYQYPDCHQVKDNRPIIVTASGKILRVLPKPFAKDEIKLNISLQPENKITFKPDGLIDGHNGNLTYLINGKSNNSGELKFNKRGREYQQIKN